MTLEDFKLQLIVSIDHVKYELYKNRVQFLENDISIANCSERGIYLSGYKDALDMILDKFKDKE